MAHIRRFSFAVSVSFRYDIIYLINKQFGNLYYNLPTPSLYCRENLVISQGDTVIFAENNSMSSCPRCLWGCALFGKNSSSIRVMLFSIPGHNCELNTDDCLSSPCKNGATCTDEVFSYTCTCASGWTGKNCDTDINECDLHVCQNNATCLNLDGTYNCTCKPGFSDFNCSTEINECASSPCVNGNCTDLVNGFNCTCFPGYTGNLLKLK